MLFESLVFGFAAGLLLGGSPRNIPKASFRAMPLMFLALALELAVSSRLGPYIAQAGELALSAIAVLQAILLISFVILNLRIPSLWLIGIGGLMNALPMAVNGGRMPISPQIMTIAPGSPYTEVLMSGSVANYMLAGPGTRLLFLSDIIPFRGITLYMISAGDIVTSCGLAVLMISLMLPDRFSTGQSQQHSNKPR